MDQKFLANCIVAYHPLHFGYGQYTCYHNVNGPIGFIVGVCHGGQYFEVVRSYVDDRFRRRGVCRLLNDSILNAFPVVTSDGATEDGRAFMLAYGYQQDPTFGWVYRKPD